MSGILDKKSRIFDTIVTLEGRRQIATGKLKAEFFSFSDAGVFYNEDTLSGSEDASRRISFEASSLPQDQITFEADDSGRLFPYPGSPIQMSNGKIVTVVTGISGSVRNEIVEMDSSQFASKASELLGSSAENFNKLYMIGSPDLFDENRDEFTLSREVIDFTITNDRPFQRNQISTLALRHVESLFQDKKLSHVPNFYYLPPVNKAKIGTTQYTKLGDYQQLNQRPIYEFQDLKQELDAYDSIGFKEVVEFMETSKQNNLFCQLFELSNGEIVKLDVIDFGLFDNGKQVSVAEIEKAEREGRLSNLESQTSHVFFAGKIFIDSNNTHTFVNMFTLIFS